MNIAASHRVDDWILFTGATGFVGQALLRELCDQGRRVLCLIRADTPAEARRRLVDALRPWNVDAERWLERGQIAVLRGDLHAPVAGLAESMQQRLRGRVAALIHAAGSTRFSESATGEPIRTNVEGTRNVLALAAACECRDWHFISTAYVAGRADRAMEGPFDTDAPPRNAYERSKREAERIAVERASAAGATLTLYRPSVVVGDSRTGQASRFVGIYYLFRACSLLRRAADERTDIDRHRLPLTIYADPNARPNLICADDLARIFGRLFASPQARGGIYHLTHPSPPTNMQIKQINEAHYDIGGGRFTNPSTRIKPNEENPPDRAMLHESNPPDRVMLSEAKHLNRGHATDSSLAPYTSIQETFDDLVGSVGDYLFASPTFDRSNVTRFVPQTPAPWTAERLHRLIAYAESVGWRTTPRESREGGDAGEIEYYFRDFLPSQLDQSPVGRMTQLDVTVRFCIGPNPAGQWWCRFQAGRVAAVEPARDQPADVTYHVGVRRFWQAVSGEITGAEMFLAGDAQIEGDVERGLKFSMILEEFVRACPYASLRSR